MDNTTAAAANDAPRFVVIDRDNGEHFSTTIFGSRDRAERERNRLALKYGKETCLGIGYVNDDGTTSDVTEATS